MSKGLKIGLVVLIVVFLLGLAFYKFFAGNYNKMVIAEENVTSKWSQVENVYQQRFDLIPNLVETVKGYAAHESKVFEDIAQARAKIGGGGVKLSAEDLDDPAKMEKFQQAQAQLGGALGRLMAISENYPDLKANQNFLALQDEIAGIENKIGVERKRFNEAVKEFNTLIRIFPTSIVASQFGFNTPKAYFKAEEEAASAPKVKF